MEYHCHLTEKEKMISHIDNQGEITINRKLFERHGLPKQNTSLANEAIFYNADNKTWQCQICNQHAGKYDWVKITNHVNNMHNGIKKRKTKNKGPHILLPDDTSIKREIDFGFIRMIYEQEEHPTEENNNQIQEGRFKCLKCGEVYKDKQRIISHISHKHHELDRVTDLKCPYCPKTYNSTTTLKVHIHTKVCTKRNDTILGKSWIQI